MPRRRGFTLIELLVVLAMALIVIGLGSIAVFRTRQAATGTENVNHLREMALGFHSHHDMHRTLAKRPARPKRDASPTQTPPVPANTVTLPDPSRWNERKESATLAN